MNCRLRNEYESRNKLYLNSSDNKACNDDFHFQSDSTLSHFMLQKLGKVWLYFWLYLTLPFVVEDEDFFCDAEEGELSEEGQVSLISFFYLFSSTPLCYNKRCLNLKGASQGYNSEYKKLNF